MKPSSPRIAALRLPLLLSSCLILTLAVALGACRGKATEVPDEPTPEAMEADAVAAPLLTVEQATVEYRERELAEGRELEEGETVEVEPGANVITSDGGRASISVEGFITQSLLTGTDTLLSLMQPELRYAILDQATGTARYTLVGAGEAASVTVKAASWSDVVIDEGEADVVVSIVPGTIPSAWVANLHGTIAVQRGDERMILEKGQVAAFTEEGALPNVVDLEAELVSDWYDDLESGKDVGSIVSVAYYCEVTSEVTPKAEPDEAADDEGEALEVGALVKIIQRDEPSTWLRLRDGEQNGGWLPAESLSCNGPASSVSMTAPGEETGPTETPVPLPTRGTILLPPTVPTPIVTRTPTWTPVPAAAFVDFSADDKSIVKGECTKIRWTVRNVKEYYVDGNGKAGEEGRETVCPDKTRTYTLRYITWAGEEKETSVKITVTEAEATATRTRTPRPAASATTIIVNTPRPPTATTAPPTTAPTVAPTTAPTNPPPTATDPPPTDEPTEEPTDPPQPTDEPTEEPTAPIPNP